MNVSHFLMSLSSWRAWIEMAIRMSRPSHAMSLSSWRAWIEIYKVVNMPRAHKSLSSWRAWIEMQDSTSHTTAQSGRSPHGERGLKCHICVKTARIWMCRSPHGERGLKSGQYAIPRRGGQSLSSWRAWIEIQPWQSNLCCFQVALLMESVD